MEFGSWRRGLGVKLIALDLDGTLLNSRGVVSERTAEALKAAHRAGIVVAPATARWYQAAVRPFASLGFTPPAIAAAGADVRTAEGHVVEQAFLDEAFSVFLVELCDRLGWTATLSTPERAYRRANELPPWAANAPEWLRPVTSLRDVDPRTVLSVLAETAADDAWEPELEAWRDRVSVYSAVSFAGDAMLTVSPPGVDKGTALRALCRDLGIDPAEAVAVGDSEVDVPMFRVAGMSVAMGDAADEAKAVATHRTGTADEDGVATVIEGLL